MTDKTIKTLFTLRYMDRNGDCRKFMAYDVEVSWEYKDTPDIEFESLEDKWSCWRKEK